MKSKPSRPASQPQGQPQAQDNPQNKLLEAQANHQRWLSLAGHPDLSPEAADAARGLATSWKAAAQLRQKAQAYQDANQDAAIDKTIHSPPSQPSSLGTNPR